jgi:hypothetical protein
MIYGELDLLTEERNAWQAGDYARAEALALAIDAEERAAEAEKGESDKQDNYDRCQEAWGRHNDQMRQRLDNLRQLIEQTARVSGRELILRRIEEAIELIDNTEGWAR